jgi:hypothetical protein
MLSAIIPPTLYSSRSVESGDAHSSACFQVRALTYQRIDPWDYANHDELLHAIRLLGRKIADEAVRCVERGHHIDDYVLSSTILSPLLMDSSNYAALFRETISKHAGRPVDWFTHAYECAGWGYVMRHVHAKARTTGQRTLLLQIADVDIHCFAYWRSNGKWGNSGFGICTILMDVLPGDTPELLVGAASQANAMVQMGRALRDFRTTRENVPVAVPFFREAERKVLIKCIGDAEMQGDGYADFGHSFGSDPWISMLMNAVRFEKPSFKKSIINSLALNGYFSIAELEFHDDALFRLETRQ